MVVDPFWGVGLGAVANIGGSLISSAGQSSANAANVAMQREANTANLNSAYHVNELNQMMTDQGRQFAMQQQDATQRFNLEEADKARTFSSAEAATAREVQNAFQERMASTQYQRAMSDMKAAGLNPMLAYKLGGNAAPAGGGQMAQSPAASASPVSGPGFPGGAMSSSRAASILNDKEFIGRALGSMVQSAFDQMKVSQDIEKAKAETSATTQSERESKSRENLNIVNQLKAIQETRNLTSSEKKILQETQESIAREAAARAAAGLSGAQTGLVGQQTQTEQHRTAITEEQRKQEIRKTKDVKDYGSSATPGWIERAARITQDAMEWWGRGGPMVKHKTGNPGEPLVIDMRK